MKRVLATVAVVASSWAMAQSADIEQVWLDPAGRGSSFVGNAQTLPSARYRSGAAAFYTAANLKSLQGTTTTVALQDRFGFHVFGALGILDWLEISTVIPVIASQQGSPALGVATAGLGNPWLHAKVNLIHAPRSLSLAVDLGVGLPLGTAAALGNGGLEVAPKVQIGRVFDAWQFGAELGLLYRPMVDLSARTGGASDLVGSQLWLAAMVSAVNVEGPRAEFTLRTFAPLTGAGRFGVEGQLGVRWPAGPLELFASGGPGFFGEPTTPTLRVYLGAAFADLPMTQPPCVEGKPYDVKDCPALDQDGDGVKNIDDRAPLAAEDKDGFQDDDGVPDADNDQDGVMDGDDSCREVAGPAANAGCPDVDSDRDGIVDRLDACRDAAEDRDDFQDSDGCPEQDNDGDGFADGVDACPLNAGIRQERGCPAKDSDGDRVFDHEDNCPGDAGLADNGGCPAARKQVVRMDGDRVKPLENVSFEAGRASVAKKSAAVIDNVAAVLAAHPELMKVRVICHAEATGDSAKNTKLAQERAEAVKAALVKKGVAEGRVTAVGAPADAVGLEFVVE